MGFFNANPGLYATCINSDVPAGKNVYINFYFQCKWFKGKTEIKKSETYEIEHDGLTNRLIIHSATLSDTGKYRCTFDDQSTFCNLTVRGMNCLHKIHHFIKSILIDL